MSALLPVTLIYIAILVLALAGGLIAIVYFLNSARANLAQVAAGLREVESNVEPLHNALTAANEGLTTLFSHLQQARHNLAGAETAMDGERRAG
jgi:uncharacterized membrane protein